VRALDLNPRELLEDSDEPQDSLRVARFLRPELGTPYDKVAAGVLKRIKNLKLLDPNEPVGLALDSTGVGRGVRDTFRTMIREDNTLPRIILKSIQITGGHHINHNEGFVNVPKKDLITAGVQAFQKERLHISWKEPLKDIVFEELMNYRLKINTNTNADSFEPWRTGDHDDTIFALCMAVFCADRWGRSVSPVPLPASMRTGVKAPVRPNLPAARGVDNSKPDPVGWFPA